jgi:hypothetical protein
MFQYTQTLNISFIYMMRTGLNKKQINCLSCVVASTCVLLLSMTDGTVLSQSDLLKI